MNRITRHIKRFLIWSFTGLAGMTMWSCFSSIAYGPPPTTSLHGRVVNSAGNIPIQGIKIELQRTSENTVTNAEGIYYLVTQTSGMQTITATDVDGSDNGGSFKSASKEKEISLGKDSHVDFDLELE